MCSVLTITTRPGQLRASFPELVDPSELDQRGVDLRAHGYLKTERAPVIFLNAEKKPMLELKHFSLCPSWSNHWPFKFETYNARLTRPKKRQEMQQTLFDGVDSLEPAESTDSEECIYSVSSFRDAFNSGQTCLVPLTGAVESCYFGVSAGRIVRFIPQDGTLIFALGLWNDWIDRQTGQVIPTFTLLTDNPDPFVFQHGHDRGVIVIDRMAWSEWLDGRSQNGKQRLKFARQKRIQPHWSVVVERELKNGWKRRAPTSAEISDIRVWEPSREVNGP